MVHEATLSDEERHAWAAHKAACPVCGSDLPEVIRRAEAAIDATAVARLVQRVEGQLTLERQWQHRRRVGLAVAASVVLVAVGALASQLRRRPEGIPSSSTGNTMSAPLPTSEPIPENPTVPEIPSPNEPPVPAPSTKTSLPVRTIPAEDESAAALFARANRARQAGDAKGAAELYRKLTRRFPQSEETPVAQVALGRLLLDHLGDASGALAAFDQYLTGRRYTALREPSLVGRARALGMLGRRDDERLAWNALLTEYPASLHAGRARTRLDALR